MVALSVVCAMLAVDAVTAVRREKAAWTRDVSVVVLAGDVGKGEVISASNTSTVRLPRALTPADALTSLPAGLTARVAMRAHTLLAISLVVPPADAVEIPHGWRVIALPRDLALPVVDPGDRVDIVVGDTVVAVEAVMVSTDPFSVAVPADVVARVAAAARLGEATVVALP